MIHILNISIGKITDLKKRLENSAELKGSKEVSKLENCAGINFVLCSKHRYEHTVPKKTM